MQLALKIKNLYYSYQNLPVLEGVSLELKKGELGVLLGASGSGKSTLLKCISQLIPYETGEIYLENREITGEDPKNLEIGYVPQGQILFPHLTVRENIIFGLKARKYPREIIQTQLKEISSLLELSPLLERKPYQLSGGQKQRVALARALAINPKLLLLDEPLASVDAFNKESLALEIKKVQKETQTTTLYVTHDQFEARLVADAIIILDKGKIIQQDNAEKAFRHPKNIQAAILMGIPNSIPKVFLSEEIIRELRPETGIILPPKKIKVYSQNEINSFTENNEWLTLNAELIKYSFDQHQTQFGIFETNISENKRVRIQVITPKIIVDSLSSTHTQNHSFILIINKQDIIIL